MINTGPRPLGDSFQGDLGPFDPGQSARQALIHGRPWRWDFSFGLPH
jgi:hypothetical protein